MPVYVRSTGDTGPGIPALREKGARDWPNPTDPDELTNLIHAAASQEQVTSAYSAQPGLDLIAKDSAVGDKPTEAANTITPEINSTAEPEQPHATAPPCTEPVTIAPAEGSPQTSAHEAPSPVSSPAEALFTTVREVLKQSLIVPTKEAEVAELLNVSTSQAKVWLQRLLEEGVVEKQKKPSGYVNKRNVLF